MLLASGTSDALLPYNYTKISFYEATFLLSIQFVSAEMNYFNWTNFWFDSKRRCFKNPFRVRTIWKWGKTMIHSICAESFPLPSILASLPSSSHSLLILFYSLALSSSRLLFVLSLSLSLSLSQADNTYTDSHAPHQHNFLSFYTWWQQKVSAGIVSSSASNHFCDFPTQLRVKTERSVR